MLDRAHQTLAKLALEPEWEAKFEPNSYGFRPGRSAHDAIAAIFNMVHAQPKYVLDADIAACFDRIAHAPLLAKLHTFPALRRAIRAWLRAGVLENGGFTPTPAGNPQGGCMTPPTIWQKGEGAVWGDGSWPDAKDHVHLSLSNLHPFDQCADQRPLGVPVHLIQAAPDGGGKVVEMADEQLQIVLGFRLGAELLRVRFQPADPLFE
jgi:hypothetical protein